MPCCCKLCIGGVVTTRTSLIGIPADFGAGGRFGFMLRQSMAQRHRFTFLEMVAVSAISAFATLFGASCSCYCVPGSQVMTKSSNVVVHITVAAGGAGVGSVTLLRAGGPGHNGFIVMSGYSNCAGFIVVAVGAIPTLQTVLCAGGIGDSIPCTVIMPQSRHIAVHIAVAAAAGVGGVALLRTSGFRYHCVVAMDVIQGWKHFCPSLTTTVAGVQFLTSSFLRRLDGYNTVIPIVTKGIGVRIHIAVTAAGTGVGGVALLYASRLGDRGFIVVTRCGNHLLRYQNLLADRAVLTLRQTGSRAGSCHRCVDHFRVTQHGNIVCNIAIATMTGVSCIPLFRTSRCGYNCFIVVARSREFRIGRIVTTLAGLIGIPADFGTGGCFGFMLNQSMAQRRHFAFFKMLAVDAISAFATLFGASSLGYRVPHTKAVTGCRYIISHISILTEDTGIDRVTLFRASRRRDFCRIVVVSNIYQAFCRKSAVQGCNSNCSHSGIVSSDDSVLVNRYHIFPVRMPMHPGIRASSR